MLEYMFHVTSSPTCHAMSTKKWSMVDGQVDQFGEVFSLANRDGRWLGVDRIGKVFHLQTRIVVDSQWSGRPV
jgi:hypothetical protein